MRLRYGVDEEAFRSELVTWLDANLPGFEHLRDNKRSSAYMSDQAREWQRKLFDNGWLVPGWPPELGGRNAGATELMIYFEEFSKRDIPRSLNPQGLGIISPSIRDYGTPDQQDRFLVPTLRAEIAWCVGMSEPAAGSDLASLRTRAVIDDDHFVINGQKVWTSGAHHSDWCLCFVRTDPDVPKHRGISALIVDMQTPGVECRPFPELSEPDWLDFNEVFFTDVVVPRENLLGELNAGWPLTQGSLAHERAMLWVDYAYLVERSLDMLVGLADRPGPDGRPLREDPSYRDAVAATYVDSRAILLMGYRGFAKSMRGRASPEHSLLKLVGSEALQRSLLAASDLLRADALDQELQGPRLWRRGSWTTQWLRSFGGTIPGGTSEIQRNIIAERVLGLPR